MTTPTPIAPPAPAYDLNLDEIFQGLVAGVTGLDPTMVRPRFQPVPPQQPPLTADWAAVGTTLVGGSAEPVLAPLAPSADYPNGAQQYELLEAIDVMVTFYGPNSQSNAGQLRDDLAIPQNTEALNSLGISYLGCSAIRKVPDLQLQKWVLRQDITLRCSRLTTRIYPIQSFVSAQAEIIVPPITRDFTIGPQQPS